MRIKYRMGSGGCVSYLLLKTGIHRTAAVLAIIGASLIVVIMIAISADVVTRGLTGRSIRGVLEIAEVLMVALVFFGMAQAQREGSHIGLQLVVDRLPVKIANVLRGSGMILVLALMVWLIWATSQLAHQSFLTREFRFGLAQVPIWPARLAIPIGMSAFFLELLLTSYESLVSQEDEQVSSQNPGRDLNAYPGTITECEPK